MSKKAVITILGTSGVQIKDNAIAGLQNKAIYKIDDKEASYHNNFGLILDLFSDYEIVPFYTDLAKEANVKILKNRDINPLSDEQIAGIFSKGVRIKNELDFDEIFASINEKIQNNYENVIIDVTHGYRHLPILAIIDSVIANFQNSQKIQKILFAKELKRNVKYEIMDLKKYLDIANLAFILSVFNDNYTITSHIKINGFFSLVSSLNEFSENLMSLNLKNFFSQSVPKLKTELENLLKDANAKAIHEISHNLLDQISDFQQDQEYKRNYNLAKKLYEKKYLLLAIALLFEGIRDYAVYQLKNIEETYYILENFKSGSKRDDEYALRDLCIKIAKPNLNSKDEIKLLKKVNKKDFNILRKNLLNIINEKLYKLYDDLTKSRNNLAHANSGEEIEKIKDKIQSYLARYENLIINV